MPFTSKTQGTLLVFNYTLDESHPALSHQLELVEALSLKFEKIIVLSGSVNWVPSGNNIVVVSTNWVPGHNIRNILNFYRKFLGILFTEPFFAVFSHMTLIQSFLTAPFLRFCKIPHYLWYAHKKNSLMLRFVSVIATGIITSTYGSCPIKTSKVKYVGQSVNEKKFTRDASAKSSLNKLVHIGRADPSKNLNTIIKAVHELRMLYPYLQLTLVGSPSNLANARILQRLQLEWGEDVNQGWLIFLDAIPRQQIPNLLAQNDIFVHAFVGSLDKTLIEATMASLPVATLNTEYQRDFGVWSSVPVDLKEELESILNLNFKHLQVEISERRSLAIRRHSLDHWVNSVSLILANGPIKGPLETLDS